MQWKIRPLHVVLFMSLLALLLASAHPAFAAPQPMSGKVASFPYSGSLECPAPPIGWNPTTATVAQLRFYGLPLPTAHSGSVYQAWVDHMRHATQRLCTPGVSSQDHTHPYRPDTAGSNGDYWSGYAVENDNNLGFDEASADWNVPRYYSGDTSARALQWVGIGGYGSNYLSGKLEPKQTLPRDTDSGTRHFLTERSMPDPLCRMVIRFRWR